MKQKILLTAEIAVTTLLIVIFQWGGSLLPDPLTGQLVAGIFTNCVLTLRFLHSVGISMAVAIIAPVAVCILGSPAASVTAVPYIAGNLCYVLLLGLISGKHPCPFWQQSAAVVSAAGTKFLVMYLLAVKVICATDHQAFIEPAIRKTIPSIFAWPQLVSALTGGFLALILFPVIKKTLQSHVTYSISKALSV